MWLGRNESIRIILLYSPEWLAVTCPEQCFWRLNRQGFDVLHDIGEPLDQSSFQFALAKIDVVGSTETERFFTKQTYCQTMATHGVHLRVAFYRRTRWRFCQTKQRYIVEWIDGRHASPSISNIVEIRSGWIYPRLSGCFGSQC